MYYTRNYILFNDYMDLKSFIITPDMFLSEDGDVLRESGIEDIMKHAISCVSPEIRCIKEDNSDGVIRYHEGDKTIAFIFQAVKRLATKKSIRLEEIICQDLWYLSDFADNFPHTQDRLVGMRMATEKWIAVLPLGNLFQTQWYQLYLLTKSLAKQDGKTASTAWAYEPMRDIMNRYRQQFLDATIMFEIGEGLDMKDVITTEIEACNINFNLE